MKSYHPRIKVVLDEGAYMPERAHDTDAGSDLRTPTKVVILPHGFAHIDTGVHIELPPDLCAHVEPRSGLWRDHHILTVGLIDRGYNGSIGVSLVNLGFETYIFKAGERIAQLTISPVCTPTFTQASEIESGERGSSGFGSSGRV